MQINARSTAIGVIPKPETGSTERRQAGREVFVKRSRAANDNLIDQTIALWQSRFQRDLSREDARQIVENVTGFFNILTEWSRAEVSVPANDNAALSTASSSAKDQPSTMGDGDRRGGRGHD
jgi:hypothetical protein